MPAGLSVEIRPSRYLLRLLITITVLACVCAWLSDMPPGLRLTVLACVAVIGASALRRHYFLHARDSIYALGYHNEQWYLRLRNAEVAATLLPTSTLTNWLLVLNFRIDDNGRKANLILLPDSAALDSMRQLKAVLRFANPRRNNSVA